MLNEAIFASKKVGAQAKGSLHVYFMLTFLIVVPVLVQRLPQYPSSWTNIWVVLFLEFFLIIAVYVHSEGRIKLAKVGRLNSFFLLAWFLLGVVSVLISEHVFPALVKQVEWCLGVVLALVVGEYFLRRTLPLKMIGLAFFGALLIVLANIFVRWYSLDDPRSFDWWRSLPIFFHVRHLNYFACASLLASTGIYFFSGMRGWVFWLVYLSFSTFSLAIIFWGGARSGLVVAAFWFASVAVYLYFSGRRLWPFLVASCIAFLVAFWGAEYFYVDHSGMGVSLFHGKELSEIGINQISSNRLEMWAYVVGCLMSNHAILGLGADAYMYLDGRPLNAVHPHNFIFQFLLDWGVGAIFFLGFILCLLTSGVRTILHGKGVDKELLDAVFVSLSALGGYLILALFTGPLYHSWSMAYFFIWLGLVVASISQVKMSQQEIGLSSHTMPSLVMAPLALVVLLHAGVNLLQNYATPSSYWSPSSIIVRAFPSHNLVVGSWFANWVKDDPSLGLRGLRWLQKHSTTNDAWRYYMYEARYHQSIGDMASADRLYEKALAAGPRQTDEIVLADRMGSN